MSEKQPRQHEIYNELRDRASYPLLLYVSKSLVEDEVDDEQKKNTEWLFDRLIVAKAKEVVSYVDVQDDTMEMLRKGGELRANLFDLVDYYATLKEAQFNFLYNNYLNHILGMKCWCDEMLKDVENGTNEFYKKYITYFKLQADLYEQHQKDLAETFPDENGEIKIEVNIRSFVVDNFSMIKKEINTIEKESTKKKYLITDEESRNYLLEKVFGVDL
ncbi:MAG: hypothetical protein ACSHXA_17530 [Polaribacter sp.]|uniref:hypothetical protein n=1 Tax=Polaribacter sp. TaxID=1920175 RepID=UPI003EF44922